MEAFLKDLLEHSKGPILLVDDNPLSSSPPARPCTASSILWLEQCSAGPPRPPPRPQHSPVSGFVQTRRRRRNQAVESNAIADEAKKTLIPTSLASGGQKISETLAHNQGAIRERKGKIKPGHASLAHIPSASTNQLLQQDREEALRRHIQTRWSPTASPCLRRRSTCTSPCSFVGGTSGMERCSRVKTSSSSKACTPSTGRPGHAYCFKGDDMTVRAGARLNIQSLHSAILKRAVDLFAEDD